MGCSPRSRAIGVYCIYFSPDSYEEAVEKMKLSQKYSDVESGQDSEQKRKKRQIRAKIQHSSDDSETDVEVSQSLLKKFPKATKLFRPLAVSTQISSFNDNLAVEDVNKPLPPNSSVASNANLVVDVNSSVASDAASVPNASGLECTDASGNYYVLLLLFSIKIIFLVLIKPKHFFSRWSKNGY